MPKQSALGVLPLPPCSARTGGFGGGRSIWLVREPISSLSSWGQGLSEWILQIGRACAEVGWHFHTTAPHNGQTDKTTCREDYHPSLQIRPRTPKPHRALIGIHELAN